MAKVESKLSFNGNRNCEECIFMKDLIEANRNDKFEKTSIERLNEYRTRCANCRKGQLKFDAIAYSMFLSKEKEEKEKNKERESLLNNNDEKKETTYVIKNRNEGKHFTMSDFELRTLFKLRSEGATYRQIANEMGMTYSKIYNAYNLNFSETTKKKLKSRLKELSINFIDDKE